MARHYDSLPFRSRTQVRHFSTMAIYDQMLNGTPGQMLRANVKFAPLEGFRRTRFFHDLGIEGADNLGVTVFHNVEVSIHKDHVAFIPVEDTHGAEMIMMLVHGVFQGYVEPLD